MTPTNKLRFVEREERHWHDDRTYSVRKVRILQQWWEYPDEPELGGQREDVPVEVEEQP